MNTVDTRSRFVIFWFFCAVFWGHFEVVGIVIRALALAVAMAALLLATTAGAQAAPAANQITVRDQNLDTGIVIVDSAVAERNVSAA